MALSNTETQWGALAKVFHWLIALLILSLLTVGLIMVSQFENDLQTKFEIYQLHKSFGITVFVLVVLRLIWRTSQPTPKDPPSMTGWERALSKLAHWVLYALMLVMPISGYLRVSSEANFRIDTEVFGLFTLPHALGPNQTLAEAFHEVHEYAGFTLIAVILIHIAAALRHHFIVKDNVLRRMLPGHAG